MLEVARPHADGSVLDASFEVAPARSRRRGARRLRQERARARARRGGPGERRGAGPRQERAAALAPRGDGRGIGLVPEDRKRNAILPTRSVQHNLSAAWMDQALALGVDRPRAERRLAGDAVERFAVKTRVARRAGPSASPAATSRRSSSRAGSRSRPTWSCSSEPTRGIDVGAKSEVYGLIQEMAEAGAGDPDDLVRAARAARPRRPDPRDVPGPDRGRVRPAGGHEEEIAHAALGGATGRGGTYERHGRGAEQPRRRAGAAPAARAVRCRSAATRACSPASPSSSSTWR